MQLIRHLPDISDQPTAVAIGNFDGLHRGHQAVIGAMVGAAQAQKLVPSVLTFEPHPRRFFGREEPAFRLERLAIKLQRLQEVGVARVYMPRFDAGFAGMTAEDFLEGVLGHRLGAKVVVTGENFAFGKQRSGDTAMLQHWGLKNDVAIVAVPPVAVDGHACSSSAVRRALEQGNMLQVAALLGRAYRLSGSVVHGAGRGAEFGFATANVALPPMLKLPAYGVYAVRATVRGVTHEGVANFGVRPTVAQDAKPVLEVHVFDDKSDSYGARMEVDFVARIRGEKKFGSLAALIAQIGQDCSTAKEMLKRE